MVALDMTIGESPAPTKNLTTRCCYLLGALEMQQPLIFAQIEVTK